MGFIKFDILGITTLKVIKHAVKLIAKRTGQDFESLKENLRSHILDMNDQKVMKTVFWDGHAGGVFQFSGQGIRRLAA
jgi:DNA polymerase III alpha subunit